MLPCLTDDGKLLLDAPGQLSMAPNGNGGVYAQTTHRPRPAAATSRCRQPLRPAAPTARRSERPPAAAAAVAWRMRCAACALRGICRYISLRDSGVLSELEREGVSCLFQFAVDNALCHVCDPTFLGFCDAQRADCASKTVPKSSPHEPVGVIALADGAPAVVEYSEISKAMAEATDANGRLLFGAAHICVNYFSLPFLRDFCEAQLHTLPLHVARKKIPYVDSHGQRLKPEKPNGVKLELFIFDTFPRAKRMVALQARAPLTKPSLAPDPSAAAPAPARVFAKRMLALPAREARSARAYPTHSSGPLHSPHPHRCRSPLSPPLHIIRGRTHVRRLAAPSRCAVSLRRLAAVSGRS